MLTKTILKTKTKEEKFTLPCIKGITKPQSLKLCDKGKDECIMEQNGVHCQGPALYGGLEDQTGKEKII